jgi:hypothetical protein
MQNPGLEACKMTVSRLLIALLTVLSITFSIAEAAAADSNKGCCRNRLSGRLLEKMNIIETDEGYSFLEDGREILFYQRKAKSLDGRFSRSDYVHPLYSLDGGVITEDFPPDHLHHRGVFWAWHQIWIGDKRIGDGWIAKDISWDVADAKIVSRDSKSAVLKAKVLWKSPLWTDDAGRQKPFDRG